MSMGCSQLRPIHCPVLWEMHGTTEFLKYTLRDELLGRASETWKWFLPRNRVASREWMVRDQILFFPLIDSIMPAGWPCLLRTKPHSFVPFHWIKATRTLAMSPWIYLFPIGTSQHCLFLAAVVPDEWKRNPPAHNMVTLIHLLNIIPSFSFYKEQPLLCSSYSRASYNYLKSFYWSPTTRGEVVSARP